MGMWPWKWLTDTSVGRQAGLKAHNSSAVVLAEQTPLISFGVCTDLQWADVDDREVHGTATRFYRRSLKLAQVAAKDFQKRSASFSIHLGDIVDYCHNSSRAKYGTRRDAFNYALDSAIAAFGHFTAGTTYHVVGNHCLYGFSRTCLRERLGMKGPGDRCYYSFVPAPSLRMVVLDTYDVAIIGNEPTSRECRQAVALLEQHERMSDALEPTDPERRWQHFNGAVGEAQLQWLAEELAGAAAQRQKVIVCSHCPVHPLSAGTRTKSLLWNYDDVLAVISAADNVLAVLSGHIHQQGHHVDGRGVHYITMPALLEAPQEADACHAFVHVMSDGFVLEGRGAVQSIDSRPAAAPER